jgi:hypothetical protein
MISIAIKNGILFILIILIIHFFIKNQTIEKFSGGFETTFSASSSSSSDDEKISEEEGEGITDDDEKNLLDFLQKEDNKLTVDVVQDVLDNIGPNNTSLARNLVDTKPKELLQEIGTFGGNNVGGLSYSPII